jgi:hypothetical protein
VQPEAEFSRRTNEGNVSALVLNIDFIVIYTIDKTEYSITAKDNETTITVGLERNVFSVGKMELAKAMLASFKENDSWINENENCLSAKSDFDSDESTECETTVSNRDEFVDEYEYLEEAVKKELLYHTKTSFDVQVGLARFNEKMKKGA